MATLRQFACRDFDGYSDANEFCADLIRINCVTWRDISRLTRRRRSSCERVTATRLIANTAESLNAGAVEQASAERRYARAINSARASQNTRDATVFRFAAQRY